MAIDDDTDNAITSQELENLLKKREDDKEKIRKKKGDKNFTDEYLTKSFIEQQESSIRFTQSLGKQWNIWCGTHWLEDQTQAVRDLVRDHNREIADRIPDGTTTQKAVLSIRSSNAVLSLSSTERSLAMNAEDWDKDPWLLATPTGTIDLQTGLIRGGYQNDYITKITSVGVGSEICCPLWLSTLRQIFPDDPEKINFLQRWFGYCLTGVTREEKFLFMNGTGRNGKGTILSIVQWIMGSYSNSLLSEVLMRVSFGATKDTDLSNLRAARMVVTSEIAEGSKWNLQRLKDVTGGDRLLSRKLYENLTPFTPTHKLIVQGNNLPKLGHVDPAISNRVILLTFKESFGDNPNVRLKDDLKLEGAGILAWMLEGCRMWVRNGLAVPKSIADDTDEYLKTMSDLALWLDANCLFENDQMKSRFYTTKELFENYCAWRKETGEGVFITNADFTNRLKTHGRGIKVQETKKHGLRYVEGIMIKPVFDNSDDSYEHTTKQTSMENGNFRGF